MTAGKFSPGPLLLSFFTAQAVIVGLDVRFERRESLFARLLQEKFVQNRRLRVALPPHLLLLKVREACRRECERTPLLEVRACFIHTHSHHIMSMINRITFEISLKELSFSVACAESNTPPLPPPDASACAR